MHNAQARLFSIAAGNREPASALASTAALAAGPDGTEVKTASPRAWSWAVLMHRAFGIDVLACAHCGGRLRLIATLHDPAVIRKILAALALGHSGPESRPRLSRVRRRRVLIGSARGRGGRRSIDGGRLSGLAGRSPGSARSIRKEAANVRCGRLEAWLTIHMMREGCFAPTLNLDTVDPKCAPLDYLRGSPATFAPTT